MEERIKDGFKLGAFFIALLFLTLFIPGLELISLVILPIPIAVYGYRYGWKASLTLSLLIFFSISVFAFYFFIISLPLALVAILAGIFIGEAIKSERHPYEVWGRGTLGFALGYLVLLVILNSLSDQSLVTEYQLLIKESLNSSEMLLTEVGLDVTSEIMAMVEERMMLLLELVPGILITVSIIYSFITQWLTHKTLNKWDKAKLAFPKFSTFQLPRITLGLYFIVVILAMFSFEGMPMLGTTVANVDLVLGMLFSIQGLSVIAYYLKKRRQSKVVSTIVIALVIIIFPVGMYLTRILGIIDAGFKLKRVIK